MENLVQNTHDDCVPTVPPTVPPTRSQVDRVPCPSPTGHGHGQTVSPDIAPTPGDGRDQTTTTRPHGTHHEGADPMNHTSSETPRWVVLTPEQRDHLEQDVTVRGRRGPVLVEGPVDHVSEHGEVTIGRGRDGVVVTGPVEVREQAAPEPALDAAILRPGDRVRLVDLDGREFHCTIRPAASQDSAAAVPDPQRLVSVRHDDLEELLGCYEPRRGWHRPNVVARLRDALRGETS